MLGLKQQTMKATQQTKIKQSILTAVQVRRAMVRCLQGRDGLEPLVLLESLKAVFLNGFRHGLGPGVYDDVLYG